MKYFNTVTGLEIEKPDTIGNTQKPGDEILRRYGILPIVDGDPVPDGCQWTGWAYTITDKGALRQPTYLSAEQVAENQKALEEEQAAMQDAMKEAQISMEIVTPETMKGMLQAVVDEFNEKLAKAVGKDLEDPATLDSITARMQDTVTAQIDAKQIQPSPVEPIKP
jgi:hypothetical protein